MSSFSFRSISSNECDLIVRPGQSFVELEARLREVFATAKEEFQLAKGGGLEGAGAKTWRKRGRSRKSARSF